MNLNLSQTIYKYNKLKKLSISIEKIRFYRYRLYIITLMIFDLTQYFKIISNSGFNNGNDKFNIIYWLETVAHSILLI